MSNGESSDQSAMARSLAARDFDEYIEAFNSRDLSRVARSLDDDLCVLIDGKEVARSRDVILPSYEADFKAGKTVEVTKGPVVTAVNGGSNDGTAPNGGAVKEVLVSVSLRAQTPPGGPGLEREEVDLDVVYVYGPTCDRQIRHEITLD